MSKRGLEAQVESLQEELALAHSSLAQAQLWVEQVEQKAIQAELNLEVSVSSHTTHTQRTITHTHTPPCDQKESIYINNCWIGCREFSTHIPLFFFKP